MSIKQRALSYELLAGLFDLTIVILTIYMLKSCDFLKTSENVALYCTILRMVLIYAISRILFKILPRISYFSLLYLLVFLCAKETWTGVLQLLGITGSNHLLFSVTGSFHNPGPYGGFLSVCVCVLLAYYVNGFDWNRVKISKRLSLIVACITLLVIPFTQSRSSLLSLISVLLLIWFIEKKDSLKHYWKKYRVWLLSGILIAGFGAYYIKKPSADGRIWIDRICVDAIRHNAGAGAGLNRFGGAYAQEQALHFKRQIDKNGLHDLDWTAIPEHQRMTADCPDYAFNEYLELGVELGLAALLVLVVMLLIPLYISFKSRSIWCYGLLSLSIFAFFSYPLHIRQFQLLFPLILSACLSDAPSTYERNLIKYFGMLFLITIPVYVYPAINDLKPQIKKIEESKLRMEDVGMWSLNKYYEIVAQESESLFPYLKNDKQYLLLYGEALSKNAEYDKSDSILLHGFNTSGDPAFLIMMGDNALEMQRYSDAKEKYKQAFYVIPNRIYPLYKIAVLYNEQCDTVRFMRMSNLIDDFIPKVESARTRRYREDIHQIKNSLLSATHD